MLSPSAQRDLLVNPRKSRISIFASALLIATSALPAARAFAQANVVENEPVTLYVDGNSGSDSNPGTQLRPFRTIQQAVLMTWNSNSNGIGTRVLVNPGIYREFVNLEPRWKMTNAPITIEAAHPGTTVIAGSDVYTGWYQGTSNNAVYTHSWGYKFGPCPIPSGWPTDMAPIMLRREMIYINSEPLTQVISFDQLQPGTFYVDESSGLLQVWPLPGTNMNTALVEVATRASTIQVNRRSNVVLRGLSFEHAATCVNLDGANIFSSSNVLVDQIQANWNNWGGFGVHSSTGVTVQNSIASYNGALGFRGDHGKQILMQFDESDYNNWRGSQGALYDFGMGGTKFMYTHGATIDQLYSYSNQGQGLWFDTDNRQITIQNSLLSDNTVTNLQLELNEGPISLQNSVVCFGDTGVNLVNASNITLSGNKLYGNGGGPYNRPQFYFAGKQGGRSFTDWETGIYYNVISSNITFNGNIFEDAAVQEQLFSTYQLGSDWAAFASTFHSSGNRWYDWLHQTAFTLAGSHQMSFSDWKNSTGQDADSVWGAPVARSGVAVIGCRPVQPPRPDFSITPDNRIYSAPNGKAVINLKLKFYGPNLSLSPLGGGGLNAVSGQALPVTITTLGLPSGISASVSPSLSTQTSMGYVLNVDASSYGSQGTVPLTIVARSGMRVHTVTVALQL